VQAMGIKVGAVTNPPRLLKIREGMVGL